MNECLMTLQPKKLNNNNNLIGYFHSIVINTTTKSKSKHVRVELILAIN